jgi:RNA polymerase sigma factor (sigma-70 family)
MDTCDLVQEVALVTVARLARFRPNHAGSLAAYLRQVARNRVCDEYRRVSRRPATVVLEESVASAQSSPLSSAIAAQEQQHYRQALGRLRPKDRNLLIARHEQERSFAAIAQQFGFPSVAAARMAASRAERRLMQQIDSRHRAAAAG